MGFQRPQGGSICAATNSLMPLGIAVTVSDCVVAFLLLLKVFTQGSFKVVPEGNHALVRRKVLLLGIMGLFAWTAVSISLSLAVQQTDLSFVVELAHGGRPPVPRNADTHHVASRWPCYRSW